MARLSQCLNLLIFQSPNFPIPGYSDSINICPSASIDFTYIIFLASSKPPNNNVSCKLPTNGVFSFVMSVYVRAREIVIYPVYDAVVHLLYSDAAKLKVCKSTVEAECCNIHFSGPNGHSSVISVFCEGFG
jgi:hypothetical protein